MNQEKKATLIGLCAIVLWSSIVGLIREVSQSFGAVGGAALIYSIACIFLLLNVGWVPLKRFSKQYLFWGGVLMVAYEVCLALSIGYATDSRQAIEIGMVNYLWPTFTMVATVIFHTRKANWLIAPGIIIAVSGIALVLGGAEGLNIHLMWLHIDTNPLSYGLAFLGAGIWAAYCVVTIKMAKGENGITLFFMLVAVVMWLKYFFGTEEIAMDVNLSSITYLLLAAAAMGFGYAAWNVGILRGNVTILTLASYFIPVFSSALSALLLSATLDLSFWKGALMVCLGSVLCWLSTKEIRFRRKDVGTV